LLGPQRDHKGQTENMVQMAMSQEYVRGSHQSGSAPPDIQSKPRRMNPEPGLMASPGHALDLDPIERQSVQFFDTAVKRSG
jgi:hypothetical protein